MRKITRRLRKAICLIASFALAASMVPAAALAQQGDAVDSSLKAGAMPSRDTLAIVQVELGDDHSAAIDSNGSLWMWGQGGNGQLGDGGFESRETPVMTMQGVKQVSLGECCTAAVKQDGSLWTWGFNDNGRLGDGTMEERATPVHIMDGVESVSLGYRHSAAVTVDGSLYVWGYDYDGHLFGGTGEDLLTPTKIMDDVKQVELGGYNMSVLKRDGSVWTWGANNDGELGDGTTDDRYFPMQVLDDVTQIACGTNGQCAALKSDGSLWAWGFNGNGELGDGTTDDHKTPVCVMNDVAQVSFGRFHSAAVKNDGKLLTWGANGDGKLGDGSLENSIMPVEILDQAVSVSLGYSHSGAVRADGSLWMWGYNDQGEIGDGTTESRLSPVCIFRDGKWLYDDDPENGDSFSGTYSRTSGITEDDLFGKYNSFLVNPSYSSMEGELRRDMSEILGTRSAWDDISSVLASNLKNGPVSNVLNAIICSMTGRYYDQDELDRTIALTYIRELSQSDSGVWDDAVDALKGNLKAGKDLYGVISNGFKNASEKREFAKAMASGAGDFYSESEIYELIRDTESNWDSISKAFSRAGRVANAAEVVYTVLVAAQADHEMIKDLLGLLESGTSLRNGLEELDRYQKHSIGSMASMMVKDGAFDEIIDLMEDQGVGRLASLVAGTGGIEIGGAVFIASLGWKVVAAGAHALGVADTDELFTAIAHISNQYALERAITRELIKIADNYNQGGEIPVSELKAEYALLYRCYLASIKSAVSDVSAVSARASLAKELQSDWSRYGRHLTYENYIASCLASANAQWLYEESGGKATITGISGISDSGGGGGVLKAQSSSNGAVPPVDIPADVNGTPVTAIAPRAFNGAAGLSCISVPDSVATIGESAFEGAAGLEAVFLGAGVTDIGASSFAGCDALADVELPASLGAIGEGAFSGSAKRLRPQEGTVGASACAAYVEGAGEGSVSIEPIAKSVFGIEVETMPAKTWYLASETADPEQPVGEVASAADARASSVDSSGLVLKVTYEDGSTAEADAGFYCEFADKSAGESHVDVFYSGCATWYPIEIEADSCAYAVSYVDQAGLKVADDATGQGMAGSAVELAVPEVEGYTPVAKSRIVTVEPGARFTIEYTKDALPSVDDAEVAIAPASYTGQGVQPEVTVRYGSEQLVRDRDYYLEYGENVGVGAGLVLIGGMGGYGGVSLREFAVFPADISSVVLELSQASYTYDGKPKEPSVTARLRSATLEAGTDYTVSYSDNVSAGTATAIVTGKGNYTGSKTATFTIAKANIPVPKAKAGLVYNGKAQIGVAAVAGYTVKGGSATNAGSYTATLTADANHTFAGKSTATVKWSIAKANIPVPKAKGGLGYSGRAQTGVAAGVGYTVKNGSATNAGSYTATLTADANHAFAGKSAATVNWSIAKAKGTLAIKGKSKKAFEVEVGKSLKKSKYVRVTKNKPKGKVTYKLVKVPKAAKKFVTVTSNGKIKVKKGIKQGRTYTVKVQAISTSANYTATSKAIAVKIKVK